jgi:starvation-inducible DNA-binding protein
MAELAKRGRFLQSIGQKPTSETHREERYMRKHRTLNDVPSNAKAASIEILNRCLADTIDLALATKQAHWNLKGPQFIAVHEMLDTFRSELDNHADTIAERVVQLGGTALGTVQTVNKVTSLPAYPLDIFPVRDHIEALIERFGRVANSVRRAIDETDEAGDTGTSDILTQASRSLDKALWFLEAHIQEK